MSTEAPERQVLYDSGSLVIISRQGGLDRGVITFGSWRADPLGDGPAESAIGFGEGSLYRFGMDELHIVPRRNHWYNCADLPRALEIATAFAAKRRVVSYGSSMGGYGALMASAQLGIPAVALAPQFSLDLAVAPFERRWRADYARIPHFDNDLMTGKGRATGFLFYDPFTKLDAEQARLFRTHSDAVLVPCAFTGHATAAAVHRWYHLGQLVRDVLDETFSVKALMAVRRQQRADNDLYQSLLHIRAASSGRSELARSSLAALHAMGDAINLKAVNALFSFFARRNDMKAARTWADRAQSLPNLRIPDFLIVSRMLQRLNDMKGARALLERGLELAPKSPSLKAEMAKLDKS